MRWLTTILFALPILAVRPSQDYFYEVPDNIDDAHPGTILRHRAPPSVITAFGTTLGTLNSTYQILYRTTAGNNESTATVLTVLTPKNASLNAVLSLQMAEDAVSIDCAPSYGMLKVSQTDSNLGQATVQLQVLLIEAALADGWTVIVPDFQGPKASFADQTLAAHAVLDGARATLKSGHITGIQSNSTVALWGYSGGASVSRIASGIQNDYAPELNIAGTAFGGLGAVKIVSSLKINGGPQAGPLPAALIGVGHQSAEFQATLDKYLKAPKRTRFYAALNQCLDANLRSYKNENIFAYFDCWDGCVLPVLKKVLGADQTPAPVAPGGRSLIYQTVHDELTSIGDVDSLYQSSCAAGKPIRYFRDEGAKLNHRNYGMLGAPRALQWLKDVRDGNVRDTKCVQERGNTVEFPPAFLNVFPRSIQDGLKRLADNTRQAAERIVEDLESMFGIDGNGHPRSFRTF